MAKVTYVIIGNKKYELHDKDALLSTDIASWAKAANKPTYTANEVGAVATSAVGANGGVAPLNQSGKIDSTYLPSYMDEVQEYESKASFPTVGEAGLIYIDISTNLTYRWGGSEYVEISPSLALGTTSSTAYRGDYGQAAYEHAVTNKGNAFVSEMYKIATNSEGHVISATVVSKNDIVALGIPAQDTTYSSKEAVSGGTDVSLVTTGEKALWNAKTSNVGTITRVKTTAGAHTAVDISNGAVSFNVPTKTSHLTNDSNFVVDASYVHTDSNFTSDEKTKLSGIAAGAQVNVQADWNQTVTTADDYIKNKPTINNLEYIIDAVDVGTATNNVVINNVKSNMATGGYSTAEGTMTYATGYASHAEGLGASAYGMYSHAQNEYTVAQRKSQTVIGRFNAPDAQGADESELGKYAFIVGNGTSSSASSNAFAITWDGNVEMGITAHAGTSSTPAGTETKVVTTRTLDFRLTADAYIVVRFTNYTAVSSLLKVDGTESKRVYYNGSPSYRWSAGEVCIFQYSGTRYNRLDYSDSLPTDVKLAYSALVLGLEDCFA